MEKKVLEIVNVIRASKGLVGSDILSINDKLRDDLELTSFDLAELTVRLEDEFDIDVFEDGLVNTVGEIYAKLKSNGNLFSKTVIDNMIIMILFVLLTIIISIIHCINRMTYSLILLI